MNIFEQMSRSTVITKGSLEWRMYFPAGELAAARARRQHRTAAYQPGSGRHGSDSPPWRKPLIGKRPAKVCPSLPAAVRPGRLLFPPPVGL